LSGKIDILRRNPTLNGGDRISDIVIGDVLDNIIRGADAACSSIG